MTLEDIKRMHPILLSYLVYYEISRYIHPSYKWSGSSPLYQKLNQIPNFSNRMHAYSSQHLCDENPEISQALYHGKDCWIFFLLLCSWEELDRMALILGALDLGPLIRSVVSRNQVLSIRETLPADIIQFIYTRHGGFYSGRDSWKEENFEKSLLLIKETGYALLVHMTEGLPSYLQKNWSMRMPIKRDTVPFSSITPAWVATLVESLLLVFTF